jgi:hypothetical protein
MGASFALFASSLFAHSTEPAPQARQAAPAARVAIDPDTGRLRPVEHDDGATTTTLSIAGRSSVHDQGPARDIYSRNGVRGMTLDESFLSFTVVRRTADGGLDSACVQGESAAAKLLQTAPVSRNAKVGGKYETE